MLESVLIMKGIQTIVNEITSVKKFSYLDDNFVGLIVSRFLDVKKHSKFRDIIELEDYSKFKKNKLYKSFLKDVKSFLHDVYAVYHVKDIGGKEKILSGMKRTKRKGDLLELHKEMLHCHSSSRERKDEYEEVYLKIFSVCGKPKKILDVGCGLNPFSLPFIGFRNFEYVGCDVAGRDIELVNKYIRALGGFYGFNGRAFALNIFEKDYLKTLRKIKCDVCLLFKMTDIFDYFDKGHSGTERFLKGVSSKFIVVSFPTRTIANRKMKYPRRKWFELMTRRLGWNYDYFEIDNECFYIVKK
tara:strand:+ start:1389 stop:2288 length:900 start_codon:yes stop_codon:yes gene_type:complete